MKKAKLLLPCVLCAATAMVIFLASCSKTGSTGPAGPAGPAGAGGAAGPAGATGTANVIYSPWIDTTTWIVDTVHNGAVIDTVGYHALLNVPKLDLTMLNTGEIKVYVNASTDPADPTVFPVPYNDGSLFIDVVFYLNTIQITSNGKLTGIPFRYILIPGGTAARTTKTIDWKNYKAVQAYLGLKD